MEPLHPTQAARPRAHALPAPSSDELAIGAVLSGRYRVIRKLGAGGMGTVYLAHDHQSGRAVALKLLAEELCLDEDFVGRFAREARVTLTLRHPHIVAVHEVGTYQGRPFLVMDFLAGETLEQRLERNGPLPLAEAVKLGRQLCSALQVIHGRGLIHRDLKSANVMLGADGRATILDFGVIRDTASPSHTQDGFTVGTPLYMPPEQALGDKQLDGRADLYALANVLYELICGRLPFEESNDALRLQRQLREVAPDIRTFEPTVPEALARVLAQALSADRNARFPDAASFSEALRVALEENRFLPSVPGPREESAPGRADEVAPELDLSWRRPTWRRWAMVALAALGLAMTGALLLPRTGRADEVKAAPVTAPGAAASSRQAPPPKSVVTPRGNRSRSPRRQAGA